MDTKVLLNGFYGFLGGYFVVAKWLVGVFRVTKALLRVARVDKVSISDC